MSVGTSIALSKMVVLANDLVVTSNNLANAATAGFQGRFMPYIEKPSHPMPQETFSYVQDLVAVKDTTQGPFIRTDDPFHVAIDGAAYFAVQTNKGLRYTRAGAFTLNNESQLVTLEGYAVLNDGLSPITMPEGKVNIMIAPDGTISDDAGQIAQLGLFTFANPYDVKDEENTLVNTDQQGVLATQASVIQHGYEGSNVNTINETNRLIYLMRAYQQVEKVIEEQNKLQSQTINSMGRPIPA